MSQQDPKCSRFIKLGYFVVNSKTCSKPTTYYNIRRFAALALELKITLSVIIMTNKTADVPVFISPHQLEYEGAANHPTKSIYLLMSCPPSARDNIHQTRHRIQTTRLWATGCNFRQSVCVCVCVWVLGYF